MEDSKKHFIQKGMNRILKRIELQNKQSSKINSILVVLTFIAVVVAIASSSVLYLEANESTKTAINALNETKKLVNWTEPKPNIQIWSDKDYWGKNGTVYIRISPDYSPYTGVNGFISPPGFSWGPITIDFLVFNSGKAPVVAAVCYIGLDCNETKDIFPFKIYNISTPLQSLFYDTDSKTMMQSYMTNFPFPHKTLLPYWQWNEKNVLDFPPSYKNGKVAFRNLILPYQYYAMRINYSNQSVFDSSIGSIGPFAIGNIEPGETKHVYVSLFGAVSDYWNMSAEYWTEQKPFASGTFTINVKSANCKMVSYSFPIKSFENPP